MLRLQTPSYPTYPTDPTDRPEDRITVDQYPGSAVWRDNTPRLVPVETFSFFQSGARPPGGLSKR
jgi:hypothetical protein